MPFETDGFFCAEVDDIARALRQRHTVLVEVFVDAYRVTLTALRAVRAQQQSARDQLIFAYSANIVTHCQAAGMLCLRGMKAPGQANIRCALESLFALGALVRAKKNLRRVRLQYLIQFRKQLELVVEHNGGRDGHGVDRSGELQKIDREIAKYKKGSRRVTVEELAKLARMTDIYEIRYRYYSGAVHADPTVLLRTHVPADTGALRFEPEDDVVDQMRELLETLSKTSRALIHHFQLDDQAYRELEPRIVATVSE